MTRVSFFREVRQAEAQVRLGDGGGLHGLSSALLLLKRLTRQYVIGDGRQGTYALSRAGVLDLVSWACRFLRKPSDNRPVRSIGWKIQRE